MQLPDVLALELEHALDICKADGWDVEVVTTLSPKGKKGDTGWRARVVRIRRVAESKLLLTATPEQNVSKQTEPNRKGGVV